ncbi:MAG TPA: hypothetical protein VHC22_26160 [Pirellulales bacterium]|nr:hypothetical protein [Pirellulales bacterium]
MKARSVKCSTCGKQHVPGFAFCQRCGAALDTAVHEDPIHDAYAAADVAPGDPADESDFRELTPAAAREMAASRRAGCAGMLAILSTVTAVAALLRTGL